MASRSSLVLSCRSNMAIAMSLASGATVPSLLIRVLANEAACPFEKTWLDKGGMPTLSNSARQTASQYAAP
jgi:hypothetical protein